MANAFTFDTSGIEKGLKNYSVKMMAGLDLYGKTVAIKMQNYAKANKPWENRTSHAMQSIQGNSYWEGSNLIIAVSGGMEYSPYLEFANDKKYAILYPTINKHKSDILSGLQNIMR